MRCTSSGLAAAVVIVGLSLWGSSMARAVEPPRGLDPRPDVQWKAPSLKDRWYIAAFGGVASDAGSGGNVGRLLDLTEASPGDFVATESPRLSYCPVVGLKLGRRFDPIKEWSGAIEWTPAVEAELLYIGCEPSARGNAFISPDDPGGPPPVPTPRAVTLQAREHLLSGSINGLLRGRVGAFEFYGGSGMGATALWVENGAAVTNGSTRYPIRGGSDVAFHLQGLCGFDWYLGGNFSWFNEYKYLWLVDPELGGAYSNSDIGKDGFHIFISGLRYHF